MIAGSRVELATVLGIAGGAALLLMVPVIRLGLGRGLKPLDKLAADVGAIHPEQLHQRLETRKLPAELVPVADRLNDWLGLADIHLLPQRADAADLVMPSKLTGMLASGRPVLATAWPHTELGRVVAQDAASGTTVPPEDAAAMAQALRALAADPARRAELGANGRRYAEQHLSRDAVLQRFEAQLKELVGQPAPSAGCAPA